MYTYVDVCFGGVFGLIENVLLVCFPPTVHAYIINDDCLVFALNLKNLSQRARNHGADHETPANPLHWIYGGWGGIKIGGQQSV